MSTPTTPDPAPGGGSDRAPEDREDPGESRKTTGTGAPTPGVPSPDAAGAGVGAPSSDGSPGPHPVGEPPLPRRRWDLTKTALVVGGVLVVLFAVAASGPWFPFGGMRVPTRLVAFGSAFLVAVLGAQGASQSYVSGRWGRSALWVGATVVLVGGELGALNAFSAHLPADLRFQTPRTAIFALGLVMVVWGLSRDSDVAHEREGANDWFTRTERILQAAHFWTSEQSKEQVRRARAEWEHAQSRRNAGTEEITPTEVFGTPEEYAASLSKRPATTTDPVAAGRWYYLTTGILLGAWATFRMVSSAMDWLTFLLFLFSVSAFAVFLWASLRQHRPH